LPKGEVLVKGFFVNQFRSLGYFLADEAFGLYHFIHIPFGVWQPPTIPLDV
jgi:hypothetical protein